MDLNDFSESKYLKKNDVPEHPGVVLARTPIGGSRVVDRPLAEPVPRIC